jgi:hypothetical protein
MQWKGRKELKEVATPAVEKVSDGNGLDVDWGVETLQLRSKSSSSQESVFTKTPPRQDHRLQSLTSPLPNTDFAPDLVIPIPVPRYPYCPILQAPLCVVEEWTNIAWIR